MYDLAHRAPVAEVRAPWRLVLFGTPEAELIQERGFRRAGGLGRGDVSAAVLPRSTVLLALDPPSPRRVVIELAPEPGFEGSEVEVALNRRTLLQRRLVSGRQRISLVLPETAQRPGRNRLRLLFPALEARHANRGEVPSVARVYSLLLGDASQPALERLAAPGAPPALSVSDGMPPTLAQAAPSALRYAVELPERAVLAFAPALHPQSPAGSTVVFRVRLADGRGEERVLWEGGVGAGESPQAAEVQVRLPATAGTPVWLTLEVEAGGRRPGGGALWRAPRVMGVGPAGPLIPAPVLHADKRTQALRESLRGVNVVLVLFDAARADHYGCYGYPHPTTPEVDRLAAEGVLFQRHYTPAVFTYSALGSLWTSQYPDQDQSEWLKNGQLPRNRLTLAELLTARGVHTAAFVASASAGSGFDLDRGFAEFHDPWRRPRDQWTPVDAAIFRQSLHPWLRAHPRQPFFLFVHYREPHTPFSQPPLFGPDAPLPEEAKWNMWYADVNAGKRRLSPEERDHVIRLYDGNLAFADRELGELRRVLESEGLWDRAVVMAIADHGEALFEHGYLGHNIQVFEESTHIPLVVRLPAGAGPTRLRVPALTSLLDLAPTIADIFGVLGEAGSGTAFRGRSLLPLLWGNPEGGAVVSRTVGVRPIYGLVTSRYKLIYDTVKGERQLYCLDTDPGEREDLIQKEPLRTAVHLQALQGWMLDLRAAELSAAEPARLDDQEVQALRALGYVN